MDKTFKNRTILRLKGYSNGYHIAALKAVHFPDDTEDNLSHTKNHTHNFYELVVVQKGKGIHRMNGQPIPFRPGNVFLLYPGEYHSYEFSEPLVLLTFMFDSHVLRSFRADLSRIPGYEQLFAKGETKTEFILNSMTIAELDIQLNSIATEIRQNIPGGELLLTAHLIHTLVQILRNQQHIDNVACSNGDIGAAVSFMMRHFHEDLQLSQLARQASLSVSSFYRKFNNEFGTSPMQWLLKLRIRKAMDFLIRSDMTIAEIAGMTGFPDPLYFSRQFRKITGMTPRNYRVENHGPLQITQGMQVYSVNRDILSGK